jgi:hypothetical protein
MAVLSRSVNFLDDQLRVSNPHNLENNPVLVRILLGPVEPDRVLLRIILSFKNSIPISTQFEHVDGDDRIVVSRFGVFLREVARIRNDSVRVFGRVVDWLQSLVQLGERIFVESEDHQSTKSDENTSSSYTQSGAPLKREAFPLYVTRIGGSEAATAKGIA